MQGDIQVLGVCLSMSHPYHPRIIFRYFPKMIRGVLGVRHTGYKGSDWSILDAYREEEKKHLT